MFCEKCGAQLNENACFCSQCGNKVEYYSESTENETPEEVCVNVEQVEVTSNETNVDARGVDIQGVEVQGEADESAVDTEDGIVEDASEEFCDIAADEVLQTEDVPSEDDSVMDEISVSDESAVEKQDDAVASSVDTVAPSDNSPEEVNNSSENVSDEKVVSNEQVVDETPEASKPIKRKRRVGAHILSSFLAIILFAFILITVTIGVFKVAFQSETIADTLSAIDLKDITVDDIADRDVLEEIGLVCDGDNVFDIIYDNIDQDQLADPLTKDEFEAIIENEEFGKYIGDVLDKNVNDLLEGKSTNLLTIEDVTDFLEKEKDTIADIVGYEITDQRVENLRKTLNDSYADVFDSLKIDVNSSPESKTVIVTASILLSDWLLILLIVFDVLLAVLIFLVMKSFRFGFVYCGIPLVIVGTLYTISAGLLLIGIMNVFISGAVAQFINQLAGVVLVKILIISGSVLVGGIIMLVIAKIIKSVQRRRCRVS